MEFIFQNIYLNLFLIKSNSSIVLGFNELSFFKVYSRVFLSSLKKIKTNFYRFLLKVVPLVPAGDQAKISDIKLDLSNWVGGCMWVAVLGFGLWHYRAPIKSALVTLGNSLSGWFGGNGEVTASHDNSWADETITDLLSRVYSQECHTDKYYFDFLESCRLHGVSPDMIERLTNILFGAS